MNMSRLWGAGLIVGIFMAMNASPASAGTAYSTLRCVPLSSACAGGWQLGNPPPWSEMVYNWASQLYNPSSCEETFRCSVDDNSSSSVNSVTITGWSAGCNPNTSLPQLTAYACKVPQAGGAGATCNFAEPMVGPNQDCSAGTKSFTANFPGHVFGDALEIRVVMDVPLNGSTSAFWAYSAF